MGGTFTDIASGNPVGPPVTPAGSCETVGEASVNAIPGSRYGAASWTDPSGNFWLFGGDGVDCFGTLGSLNDLWEFNPTSGTWTWQSGSNTVNALGSYGTLGVASTANVPPARSDAASWTDRSGNLWLFSGSCYQSYCNDLWEFNPTSKEWTWVGGSSQPYSSSPSLPPPTDMPSARYDAVSWTDSSGNLWLFGGSNSNDLWKFDPTAMTWTCVSGTPNASVTASYGVKGVASPSNIPPARDGASGWTDSKGNFWMYGGSLDLSDLWEFNPNTNEWTWVAGNNSSGQQVSVFGTQGTPSDVTTPGVRYGAVSWIDGSDNLWLFGGESYAASDSNGTPIEATTNDLWKFNPNTKQWVWVSGPGTVVNLGTAGNYENIGVPSATSLPNGRGRAAGWTDKDGNFWLFGGQGFNWTENAGPTVSFNDLWLYQP